jgi:3-isopropylmalate/(R)-2-methylmalate dehydratase small subunit
MEAFRTHTGIGVPLRRSNVDTDQIIPAVYLKRVTRTGFEDGLFATWRTDPEFILNLSPFDKARSWSPGRISAPVRRASMPCGR